MATTIRLTLNNQLKQGLEDLKAWYPFMKADEIFKMLISRGYMEEKHARVRVGDLPMVTEEEEKQIGRALKEHNAGKGIKIDMQNKEQVKKYFGVEI